MAKTAKKWDDELCAEHDGSIASFKNLGLRIDDISDYKKIFERDSLNLVRAGKIAGATIAGAAVFAPLTLIAAPGMASALGAAGLLGAAGTGTAIASLSGAALSSASLAAIGGGTMLAGTIVITATGAALGAYQGGVISNNYFGGVDHFSINKIASGSRNHKHAVIFINGFLSQSNNDTSEWTSNIDDHFMNSFWYHTDWESKNLKKLGAMTIASPKIFGAELAKQAAKKAAEKSAKNINPLKFASLAADIFSNPWHATMTKAGMTGVMLADAISRTDDWTFTLVGHSLGARVIYYALEALSTKDGEPRVKDAFLLGGAVGGGLKDAEGWIKSTNSVSGKIYNCYSEDDLVLKYLYKCANAGASAPIGYNGISTEHPKIFDFNCTALVSAHSEWKENFGEILTQLKNDYAAKFSN